MTKFNDIYLEDDIGSTHTMSDEEAFKKYVAEIMYAIKKPQGIISLSDFEKFFTECALAAQDHVPLGVHIEIEIRDLDTPGIATLRIISKKQNWFRTVLAHIGLFFIKLSRQKIKMEK
jgi:hypothetical protein